MALPYINLFIGDIQKDTDLLSPQAFGGYMRLMFKMHLSTNRGEVAYTLPQLCRVFAAATIDETQVILNEIVDPAYNICEYEVVDGKHFFRNRRMIKETAISQARREAGRIGAEKTNSKNKSKNTFAEDFAAAKPTAFESASDTTNESAKEGQNTGIGIGIGNNNGNEYKGGAGENVGSGPVIDNGTSVYVVPELLQIFKKLKPRYVYQQEKDFPALRKIAETIAEQEGVMITEAEGVERVKETWEAIVSFLLTDNLYKNFQLSQIEKYFQAICDKFRDNNGGEVAAGGKVVGPGPKPSTIQNNMNAAQGAREMMERKYSGGQA